MNRTKYQYQILRYMPDLVSEEFVNVGVVVYNREQRFLKAETIHKYARITQFFDGVNGNYLLQTVKHIRAAINTMGEQIGSEVPFELSESLDAITRSVLPKDDSALFFTETATGLDMNLSAALEKLQQRYLKEQEEGEHTITDREVWQEYYKPFFEKHGIAAKLHHKTIVTSTEKIEFDHAYKNGHWNCLEAANFDLKMHDSIKSKVWKIIGKLDALSASNEELEYHVLANVNTKDKATAKYIREKLNGHKIGKAKLNLVTRAEVSKFIQRVEKDLEEHS